MNEEIKVAFGGDLGPIGTALRGLKGMMSNAADSIKDSFKDAFHHLTAPISVAGAMMAVRSLMEDVKNIKRISESTGLDTGVTQDLLNLGKASGVASDAIESMLDKFVKGLAPGSDPEEALYQIADRMSKIEDPGERARLAVENFGKSGAKLIPVLMQGADGVKRLAAEWGKLDEVQIDLVEHTNQQLEKAGSKSKVLLAQWIEGMKLTSDKLKDMPWWKKLIAGPLAIPEAIREARNNTTPDQPDIVTTKAAQTPAEAAKKKIDAGIAAAKKIADEEAYLFAKPQEKVLTLTRQILALRRQIEDTTDPEEQVKLGEKMVDLEGKRKSIADGIAQSEKTAAEKKVQAAEKAKQIDKEILSDSQKLSKLGRDRNAAQMSEYMPSLEEVANSGYSVFRHNQMEFQQGPFAQQARQLLNLQQDAKQALIWGNQDRFKQDTSRIEELKKALRSEGVMTADDRLQSIDENIDKTQQHMSDLLDKANGAGIKVVGTDD